MASQACFLSQNIWQIRLTQRNPKSQASGYGAHMIWCLIQIRAHDATDGVKMDQTGQFENGGHIWPVTADLTAWRKRWNN